MLKGLAITTPISLGRQIDGQASDRRLEITLRYGEGTLFRAG